MKNLLTQIGPLRTLLAALVLILILTVALADGEVYLSGWKIFPSLIAPALVPILVFVLPLDMIMCAVFMSDKQGAERGRYRTAIWVSLVLLLAMLAAWGPYFYRLLRVGS